MTFSSTILRQTIFGDMKIAMGTYTQADTETGGDIVTGLQVVKGFFLCNTSGGLTASPATVNETLPCTGTVTIVTEAHGTGIWIAIGY